MRSVDVLIITALPMEHEAVCEVAKNAGGGVGIESWKECREIRSEPYLIGHYHHGHGRSITVALAHPTRMGATATTALAATLIPHLNPKCLAMSGVCAGNADETALGDVIIAETVYAYDEGKQHHDRFEGDHRQFQLQHPWLRAAQELKPNGLPSYGPPSPEDAQLWLLDRLYAGQDPSRHPAKTRYFPNGTWKTRLAQYEAEGLIVVNGLKILITEAGQAQVEKVLLLSDPPQTLPFDIKVGPIASGNAVIKDGLTWDKLKKWGVRTVVGLEMEAAAIGGAAFRHSVPHWIVVKGVMDHADATKDDRFKRFAARASAEVLFRFLLENLPAASDLHLNPKNEENKGPRPQ